VIYHWNGSDWTRQPSPNPPPADPSTAWPPCRPATPGPSARPARDPAKAPACPTGP
jgi:hypothetical protein